MSRTSRTTLARHSAWGIAVLVAAAATLAGSYVHAQPPAPTDAKANKVFTNKTMFHLPIQIDATTRSGLREVCLYVKMGSGEWLRKDVVPPTQPFFTYRVSADGEYWFAVVTVDKNGASKPEDLTHLIPGLMVVVDSQAPVLDVQPWTSGSGDRCLRCQMNDANPDYSSLKLSYRLGESTWINLEPVAGQQGVFQVTDLEALQSVVKVTACDKAGNTTTREINLREQAAAASPAPRAPVSPPAAPAQVAQAPAQAPAQPAPVVQPTPIQPTPAVPATLPPAAPVQGAPLPLQQPAAAPVIQQASNPPAVQPTPHHVNSAPSVQPAVEQRPTHVVAPAGEPGQSLAINGRQLLNCTRASIDYRVDQVGPSGVGKVEVYITTDNGQAWRKLSEDIDRRSPAEVDLPGEGVYGIRLVLTNGNGFGGHAPARGDQPTSQIEVDMTAPFVQLRDVEPVVQNGNLELRWTCTDKNLPAEPINLFYSARREGPWTPIAWHVKNDGVYRWAYPREAGGQFYLRLEATDLAGNTARVDSPNPVVLDTTEPRAQVVNITAMPSQSPPPPSPRGN